MLLKTKEYNLFIYEYRSTHFELVTTCYIRPSYNDHWTDVYTFVRYKFLRFL